MVKASGRFRRKRELHTGIYEVADPCGYTTYYPHNAGFSIAQIGREKYGDCESSYDLHDTVEQGKEKICYRGRCADRGKCIGANEPACNDRICQVDSLLVSMKEETVQKPEAIDR